MLNRNQDKSQLGYVVNQFKRVFRLKREENIEDKVEKVSREVQECNQFISAFEVKREELIRKFYEKYREYKNINSEIKEANNNFNRCCSYLVKQNNEKTRTAVFNAAIKKKYCEDNLHKNILLELKRLKLHIGFNILDTYTEMQRKNRLLNKEMEFDHETYRKFCLGIKLNKIFDDIDKKIEGEVK